MFLGRYDHNLDEKQRLTIPAKLRSKITATIYVSGGIDSCLQIRTENSFKQLMNELNVKSGMDSKARLVKRSILGNTCELEMDSMGRINIPNNILILANISKNVSLIGQGDYIEIWDTNSYNKYMDENKENLIAYANSLGE